jgi:hypothetical protein
LTVHFAVNFYALTEGTSTHDYVIGFFSKVSPRAFGPPTRVPSLFPQEKVSYDGNNLACIVIFPPYQKRRFGMLLIEFSPCARWTLSPKLTGMARLRALAKSGRGR